MAYSYPYYQQTYQQQQNNGLIWVQGEAAAKSYLVAPNTSVVLWDSEAQTVYIKSADASGMPNIKVLDYTIRDTQTQPQNAFQAGGKDKPAYVTQDELRGVYDEIKALREKIEKMEVPE